MINFDKIVAEKNEKANLKENKMILVEMDAFCGESWLKNGFAWKIIMNVSPLIKVMKERGDLPKVMEII